MGIVDTIFNALSPGKQNDLRERPKPRPLVQPQDEYTPVYTFGPWHIPLSRRIETFYVDYDKDVLDHSIAERPRKRRQGRAGGCAVALLVDAQVLSPSPEMCNLAENRRGQKVGRGYGVTEKNDAQRKYEKSQHDFTFQHKKPDQEAGTQKPNHKPALNLHAPIVSLNIRGIGEAGGDGPSGVSQTRMLAEPAARLAHPVPVPLPGLPHVRNDAGEKARDSQGKGRTPEETQTADIKDMNTGHSINDLVSFAGVEHEENGPETDATARISKSTGRKGTTTGNRVPGTSQSNIIDGQPEEPLCDATEKGDGPVHNSMPKSTDKGKGRHAGPVHEITPPAVGDVDNEENVSGSNVMTRKRKRKIQKVAFIQQTVPEQTQLVERGNPILRGSETGNCAGHDITITPKDKRRDHRKRKAAGQKVRFETPESTEENAVLAPKARDIDEILRDWQAHPDDSVRGGDVAIAISLMLKKLDSRRGEGSTHLRSRPLSSTSEAPEAPEDDENPVSRNLRNRMRTSHRSASELELKSHIRATYLVWMHRDSNKSPFTLPDPSEVDLFESTLGRHGGPSFNPGDRNQVLKLDVAGKVKSPWNQACIDKFVDAYMQLPNRAAHDPDSVRKAMDVHFKALNLQYLALNPHKVTQAKRETLVRTALRTRHYSNHKQVGKRRLAGSLLHEDAKKFHPIISVAGVNAHSDDEATVIDGVVHGVTEILEWRSKPFTEVLHLCGTLFLSTKFSRRGKPTSSFPRPRMTGSRKSTQDPVSGLPENCYDDRWKKRMGKAYCDKLRMTPATDLTISKAVAAYAAKYRAYSLGRQYQEIGGKTHSGGRSDSDASELDEDVSDADSEESSDSEGVSDEDEDDAMHLEENGERQNKSVMDDDDDEL